MVHCHRELAAQDGPDFLLSNSISDHVAWIDIDEFRYITQLILKMCGPRIENEHLWAYTKFMCLHIPISLA